MRTTAEATSGQCDQYSTFPGTIPPAPSSTAPSDSGDSGEAEPLIRTESGAIVSWPSQTVEWYKVPGVGATPLPRTKGAGTPVTLGPADPEVTEVSPGGSSQCHAISSECDKAVDKYEDDKVYTEYTSYTQDISANDDFVAVATFGKAGCAAMFSCDNDNYGLGFTGNQLKKMYVTLLDFLALMGRLNANVSLLADGPMQGRMMSTTGSRRSRGAASWSWATDVRSRPITAPAASLGIIDDESPGGWAPIMSLRSLFCLFSFPAVLRQFQ